MKTKITVLFILFSVISHFQPYTKLEDIKKLSSFSKIIQQDFWGRNQKDWKSEYTLRDTLQGEKIVRKESFYKGAKRGYTDYFFDSNGNLLQIIYNANKKSSRISNRNPNPVYNSENLLTEDKFTFYKYNENQKIKSKIHKEYNEELKTAWKYEYEYNNKGLVSKETKTTFIDNQKQVEIESYLYDDYENVIEVNRESNPEMKYPIIVIGGRSRHKKENYEYEYQNDIWIKKYWILEGEKYLLSEREIIQ